MDELMITTIGTIGIERDGEHLDLQPGQRQLLALLVACGPPGASAEWLADEIWPGRLPSQWRASIRVAVSRLRKRSGLDIPLVNGRYVLDVGGSPIVDGSHAVDLWLLRQVGEGDHEVPDDALPYLVGHPTPFPDIEWSPALQQAAAEVGALQRSLIRHLADTGRRLPASLLVQVARHLAAEPWDEDLTRAVARLHAEAGLASEAVRLIHQCATARQEELGLDPSPELAALADRFQTQAAASPEIVTPEPDPNPAPTQPVRLPGELERRRARPFVGRHQERHQLATLFAESGRSHTAVISGPPGSGKSALLAEHALHLAQRGWHLVPLSGSAGGQVGLSPLTTTIRAFGAEVEAAAELGLDAVSRLGHLALRLLRHLDDEAAGRPTVLLIDDAQWLDGPTCELLDFIIQAAEHDHTLSVVLAARTGTSGPSPWSTLAVRLDQGQAATVNLDRLDEDELAELVASRLPEVSLNTRAQLAHWLSAASGGQPLAAEILLQLQGQPGEAVTVETEVHDRLVQSLPGDDRQLGASAAVLGTRFRLAELAELVGRPVDELFEPLDRLAHQGMVMETGRLDELEFSHQLITDAFLRSLLAGQRAHLHRRASELTDDVHATARHLTGAGALVPPAEVAAALVASGRAHLEAGAFWEATSAFRAASGHAGDHPEPRALVDFARALSLAGSRGPSATIRQRAFELAMSAGDAATALDAAVAGLPEADVDQGEPDRLAQLEAIDPGQLDHGRRLHQTIWASRLASQLGQPETASSWTRRATALARGDEEQALAALAARFVSGVDHPAAVRLKHLDEAVADLTLPPSLGCRIEQFRAIDQLDIGDRDGAEHSLDLFERLAVEANNHVRQWHALVFRSLLHEIDQRYDEADATADLACRRAHRLGIEQADVVRLAQLWFRHRAQGSLADLLPVIDAIPTPDTHSDLFRVARATVLVAAGHQEAGEALARDVTEQALNHRSATSLYCLVGCAPALARAEPELKARVTEVLDPFRADGLVVGIGLGYIPSVDAALDGW